MKKNQSNALTVEKASLHLDWATYKAAKYACQNWHYSKCVPASGLVKIGIWENKQFVGVIIFGGGATRHLVKSYGLKPIEGCELVRIALSKHITPVTRLVAIAIKMLKKSNPGLRLIVSFADPAQGHHGGVYQGGGWIYSGRSASSPEYLFRGKLWQGRSFRASHKGMEHHPSVKIVMGSSKYRYLMPLDSETRIRLESLRKTPPKRAVSKENVASVNHIEEGGANPTTALQK